MLEQSWKNSKSQTQIIFCWDTKIWFIFLRISFLIRANKKFLFNFSQNWLDICLHNKSNSWTFLIKLRIDFSSAKMLRNTVSKLMKKFENSVSRLMKKLKDSVSRLTEMLENTVFWLRLLVFLYSSRSFAVNLTFD